MKYTLIFAIVLFSITGTVEASMPASPGAGACLSAPVVTPAESTMVKGSFLKRFAEKTLYKRLKKMAKATGRSGDSDGRWLAISGLTLGVLGVFSFAFIYSTAAFYLPLALSAVGLLLSILGLIKASEWEDTRWIRILAIIGIVINAIALPVSIAVI